MPDRQTIDKFVYRKVMVLKQAAPLRSQAGSGAMGDFVYNTTDRMPVFFFNATLETEGCFFLKFFSFLNNWHATCKSNNLPYL